MKDTLIKPFVNVHRRSRRVLTGIPLDLFCVVGFVLAASLVLAVLDVSSALVRATVGIPLLLFFPGYVLISICFPRASHAPEPTSGLFPVIVQSRNLSDVERVALSFGLSLTVLPLIGVALGATQVGYAESTVVGSVGGFVLIGALLAIVRRSLVPASDRYQIQLRRRLEIGSQTIFDTESTVHTAVNVVLVLSLLIAITSVGYALIAPQQGEQYTNLHLATESESNELVTSNYSGTIGPDESIPVGITVDNEEGQDMNYTVVIQEQQLEDGEVVDRTELRRIDYVVGDGETRHSEQEITPVTEEGEIRISVQVYLDDVPQTPTHEDAYRYTYFWTTITEPVDDAGDETAGGDAAGDGDDGGIFDFGDDDSEETDDDSEDTGTDDDSEDTGTDGDSEDTGTDDGDD